MVTLYLCHIILTAELKLKPRRGGIMVGFYWRYKFKPRRGGIMVVLF